MIAQEEKSFPVILSVSALREIVRSRIPLVISMLTFEPAPITTEASIVEFEIVTFPRHSRTEAFSVTEVNSAAPATYTPSVATSVASSIWNCPSACTFTSLCSPSIQTFALTNSTTPPALTLIRQYSDSLYIASLAKAYSATNIPSTFKVFLNSSNVYIR